MVKRTNRTLAVPAPGVSGTRPPRVVKAPAEATVQATPSGDVPIVNCPTAAPGVAPHGAVGSTANALTLIACGSCTTMAFGPPGPWVEVALVESQPVRRDRSNAPAGSPPHPNVVRSGAEAESSLAPPLSPARSRVGVAFAPAAPAATGPTTAGSKPGALTTRL